MARRILLVTNIFLPAIGGPATFSARLASKLVEKGWVVRVLCATPMGQENDDKFNYRVIRKATSGNSLQRELGLRIRLLMEIFRADLTYCMGLEHQTHWACKLLRKKYVLRIGGDSVWEGARNNGITSLEPADFYKKTTKQDRSFVQVPEDRRLAQLRTAAAIVYVSEYLRNLARLWSSHRSQNEVVIPNGVEIQNTSPVTKRTVGEPLRLLFVGRQTNWKGVDAVLLALRELGSTTLTVVGSGPELPANVDLARRLGLLDRTEFLGSVGMEAVVRLMSSHHILLLPSLYEGMSNTLLEAGVAGLACIASKRGGNPELIEDGRTGRLVDPFDIENIVSVVRELEANESERVRLAKAHREKVCKINSLSSCVESTVDVLEMARQVV